MLRDSCPYSFSLHRPNGTFPEEPGAAIRGCLSQPSFSALQVERQCIENGNKLRLSHYSDPNFVAFRLS